MVIAPSVYPPHGVQCCLDPAHAEHGRRGVALLLSPGGAPVLIFPVAQVIQDGIGPRGEVLRGDHPP